KLLSLVSLFRFTNIIPCAVWHSRLPADCILSWDHKSLVNQRSKDLSRSASLFFLPKNAEKVVGVIMPVLRSSRSSGRPSLFITPALNDVDLLARAVERAERLPVRERSEHFINGVHFRYFHRLVRGQSTDRFVPSSLIHFCNAAAQQWTIP